MISIEEINLRDERFRTSYFFDKSKLRRSIECSGINYPVWLVERKGRFVLASGWRRLLVCQELGLKEVPFQIIEEAKDAEMFFKILQENLSSRDFDVLEKAEVVKKVKSFGSADSVILEKYCLPLEIPRSIKYIQDFVRITQLDYRAKGMIFEKKLPFQIARLFLDYNKKEQKLLVPKLKTFGRNKIRETFELLTGISKRERRSPLDILKSREVEIIWSEYKVSEVQKAERFLEFLRKKYYPFFYRTTKKVEKILFDLDWPKDIKLKPSPFFEKNEYTLSFSFSSKQGFKEKVERLGNTVESESINRLFSLFSDEE